MTRQINILYNSSFLESGTARIAAYSASTTSCTVTTVGAHSFLVNQIITVTGLPSRLNGTFTITGVNYALNTVTYQSAGDAVAFRTVIGSFNVESRTRTTSAVTLTLTTTHELLVGDIVTISSINSAYNGTYTLTGVDGGNRTITYAKSNPSSESSTVSGGLAAFTSPPHATNSISTPLSGWTTVNINDDLIQSPLYKTFNVVSSSSTISQVTLTTSVAHNLTVGQRISVGGVGIRFDGDYAISAVTGTTVTYLSAGSAYATSEVSAGTIATTPYSWWGDYSAAVTKSSSAYPGLISDLIPITGGLTYSLSAYILLPITNPATTPSNMIVRIEWYETLLSVAPILNTTVSSSPQTLSGSDEWSFISIEGTVAPTAANYARISVVEDTGSSVSSGEVFYVDAILLTQSEYVFPYVDNYVQKQENRIVNKTLTPEPDPHITGMQLNADIALGKLILNTIDEDETVWVCTDIDGWWTLAEPEIPDIPRGVQDGSYDITGRYQARTMNLTGVFLPKNAAGVAKARRKLIEATNLTRRGDWLLTSEQPVTSSFVKLAGRPQIQTVNARGRTEFSIPLRAADPIKYEWNHEEPDGYSYLTIAPDATANVQNIGNADVTAKFTITGPVDAGTNIYDARTEETITLITNLRGGEKPIAYATNKEILNSVATLTTQDPHNLVEGDEIIVSGMGAPFDTNGVRTYTISAVETTFSNSISFPMPAGTSNVASTATTGTVALSSSDVLEVDTYTRTVTLNGSNSGARTAVETLVDWIKLKPGTNYIQFNEVIAPYPVQFKSYDGEVLRITNKELTSGKLAIITTATAHGFARNTSVVVEDVDATFNGRYVIKSVPSSTTFTYDKDASPVASVSSTGTVGRRTATLITKDAHFLTVGDTVSVNLPESADIVRKELTANQAILTTERPHGFSVGDQISVTTTSNLGVTKKSLTSNYAGLTLNEAGGVVAGDSIVVALPTTATITRKQRADNDVTLTTGSTHGFAVGDRLEVTLPVSAVPSAKEVAGTRARLTTASGHNFSANDQITLTLPTTTTVTNKVLTLTDATLTTSSAHGFSVGDWILPNLPTSTPLTSISSVTRKYTKNVAEADNCQVTLNTGTHKFSVGDTITVNVGVTSTVAPTNKSSSVRTKTLTFAADHNFSVGENITISGVDVDYNGTYNIASLPSTTTFTYVVVDKTTEVTGKSLTSNVATITTSSAHLFVVGESVAVTGVDATFNGTFVVTAITPTTLSYAVTASNVAFTAVSPSGSVANSLTQSITATSGSPSVRNNMIADGYNGTKVVTAVTSTSLSYFYYGLNQITTTSNIAGTSPTIVDTTNKILNKTIDITFKALTSNVATLTTSSAHGYLSGDVIVVANVDATFNGTYVITSVPSATSLSYAAVAANVASTSATGTVTRGAQITSIPTTTSFVYSR